MPIEERGFSLEDGEFVSLAAHGALIVKASQRREFRPRDLGSAGVIRWISGSNVGVSFNECLAFETLARWIQARREGLGRLADGSVTAS